MANSYNLIVDDCLNVLKTMEESSIDCIITSPPYYKQRIYEDYTGNVKSSLGNEDSVEEYVANFIQISNELYRVLKPTGTFWLNIGDKYQNNCLLGVPWRIALAMTDSKWILRSDVIWNQIKGTQSVKNRFRNIYEHMFQFTKSTKYYFDDKSIRIKPTTMPKLQDGKFISSTGVSGEKYRKMILSSTELSSKERNNAIKALDDTINEMKMGYIVDFRMTIRGCQRTYHSSNFKISGRAKELNEKGFYIIKSGKDGCIPSNIWNIPTEDTHRKDSHCAVYPEELLTIPIISSCPVDGIILDPFCGTGTTIVSALKLGRNSIGIDVSEKYIDFAKKRINKLL